MASERRSAMVESAASLIGAHGVNSTSFSEVIARSGAPRGSIYHYFPRGKQQLAEDAIEWTSAQILAHIESCPNSTPDGVMEWFIELWRRVVEASRGSSGCVVAGVAIDTAAGEEIMGSVRSAFRTWTAALSARFEASGLDSEEARQVALTAIAAMEGALIISRAEGDTHPVADIGDQLLRLVPRDKTTRPSSR
jgi:TetR/AcrR family transcriptional regulator, lmrAB and yxaGH operons repressor